MRQVKTHFIMIYQELTISLSLHHDYKRTLNVAKGHGITLFYVYYVVWL